MRIALITLLLWPAMLWGQAIKLPATVSGDPGAFIRVPSETAEKEVRWYAVDRGLQLFPVELLKDSKTAVVIANAKGRYRIIAWTAKGDIPSLHAECTVIIGDAPPVPPGPDPGPKPPDPPTPGPVTGLRVLIVEESGERGKLPAAQQSVLFSKTVRDWLDTNCRLWPEGMIRDWGMFDKDFDLSQYSKDLQTLMARPRTSVPWVVIAGDKGVVHEGPLPANVPAMMELLNRFAPKAQRKAG